MNEEMSNDRIKVEMEELDQKTTMLTQVSLGFLLGGGLFTYFSFSFDVGWFLAVGILFLIIGLLSGKKTLSDNKKYKELKKQL